MSSMSFATLRSMAAKIGAYYRDSESRIRQVIGCFELIAAHYIPGQVLGEFNGDAFTASELESINNILAAVGGFTFTTLTQFNTLYVESYTPGVFMSLRDKSSGTAFMLGTVESVVGSGLKMMSSTFNLDDAITSLQASACVNDWIATVSDNVRGFTAENISGVYTAFVAKYRQIPDGAAAFIGASIERLRTGGIINFFTTLKQALTNFVSSLSYSDSKFTFTDNTNFAPLSYVAGVIGSVVATALSAIAIITTLVNRVVGIIAFLLIQLGTFIGNAIHNAVTSDTHVTANGVLDQTLRVWPFALFQRTIPLISFPPNMLDVLDTSASGIVGFDVPGGLLLAWHENPSDASTPICIEFHPATCVDFGPIAAGFWIAHAPVSPSITWTFNMPSNVKGADVFEYYFSQPSLSYGYYNTNNSNELDKKAYNCMYMAITWFITWMLASIPSTRGDDDEEFRAWLAHANNLVDAAGINAPFYDSSGSGDPVYNSRWFIGTLLDCDRAAEQGEYNFVTVQPANIFSLFGYDYMSKHGSELDNYVIPYYGMPLFIANMPNIAWTTTNGDDYYPSFWTALEAYDDFLSNSEESADYYIDIDVSPVYELNVPKYSVSDVISGLVAIGIATVVTVAVATATYLSAKKELSLRKAEKVAALERAHNDLVNNPSIATAAAYRKEASQYNHTWGILSGDKYSYSDYWSSPSSNPSSASTVDSLYNSLVGADGVNIMSNGQTVSLIDIMTLIRGY